MKFIKLLILSAVTISIAMLSGCSGCEGCKCSTSDKAKEVVSDAVDKVKEMVKDGSLKETVKDAKKTYDEIK